MLLELVIKPVVKLSGYKVLRADLTYDQSTIPDSISEHILRDDLVVADLTNCNPNVFYELGKRHAWGGKCVHLTQTIGHLPFDISHHRVIEYDLSNPERIEKSRRDLRLAVQALELIPAQCPFPFTPEDVIRLSGCTILVSRVTGRRDHYYLIKKLVEKDLRCIFLMQRSSSLILGPEQGWGWEKVFYDSVLEHVDKGVELFHIVSLEGIARHLAKPESTFPDIEKAIARLRNAKGLVAVEGCQQLWYFKKVPDGKANIDIKPDRQARVFLSELADSTTEGLMVLDLGSTQTGFHLKGPEIGNYMHDCVDFYHACDYLRWDELDAVLGSYLRRNPTKKLQG